MSDRQKGPGSPRVRSQWSLTDYPGCGQSVRPAVVLSGSRLTRPTPQDRDPKTRIPWRRVTAVPVSRHQEVESTNSLSGPSKFFRTTGLGFSLRDSPPRSIRVRLRYEQIHPLGSLDVFRLLIPQVVLEPTFYLCVFGQRWRIFTCTSVFSIFIHDKC